MNKTELKKKLEDVKSKLKTNSKDVHFADALIDELLSIKGQIDHEPTLAYLPLSEVEAQLKGDTFEMSAMKDGTMVFHTFGGYTLIASPRLASLNETLRQYVFGQELLKNLNEEELDIYELNLAATTQVLTAPSYAFCDEDLKFGIAKMLIEWIRKTYETQMSKPLATEDLGSQAKWEDAMAAVDDISDTLIKP